MGVHVPSSAFFPNGVVEISSSDGSTYDEIIQSLGSINYYIKEIYIQSVGIEQILEFLTFQKYDVNGNIQRVEEIPTVDPTQYRNSINLDFEHTDYILDGKLSIGYDILPSEIINFYIYNRILGNSDMLESCPDFDEDFLKTYGYFVEYKNKLKVDP